MNLDKYFEEIYCINLEERKDRWEHVSSEFRKLGLNKVKKFSAIKSDPGYLGCRDSHIKIIQEAKQNKNKNVLIFEDDVVFVEKNLNILPDVIMQLGDLKWDMLYLGATIDPTRSKLEKVSKNLLKTNFAYATHAYALNHTIFDYIINNGAKHSKIDVFYSRFVIPKYNTLILDPIVALQRPDFSDILKKNVDYSKMIDQFKSAKIKNKIL